AATAGLASYSYGKAGTFTPKLRVMDDSGLTADASSEVVVTAPLNPMVTDAECDPAEGNLPLEVTLNGSAVGGSGAYVLYVWDFEGDGVWDHSSSSAAEVVHTYTDAGSYSPTLKIVDSKGLAATDSTTVAVRAPENLKVWMSVPKNGATVSGEAVSLHAQTAPGNLTEQVKLQFKGTDGSDWRDIGGWIYPPAFSFMATWDVTGLTGGAYYSVRAVAIDTRGNTVYSPAILVKVLSSDPVEGGGDDQTDVPEVVEGYDDKGNPNKRVKVYRSKTQEIMTNDNTRVKIPFGALSKDTTMDITLLLQNPHSTGGTDHILGTVKRITLDDETDLSTAVEIVIPYSDQDNDGYVDGTDILETELRISWHDDANGVWQTLGEWTVDPDANTVTGKAVHFTDFVIGGPIVEDVPVEDGAPEDHVPAAFSGGGGGCFISTAK
ncbi:PKD domain-containing protein, partial [Planctomycetota bacterium]